MTGSPTLRPLALRVVMASFVGPRLPGWAAALLADGLGGIALFGSNVADTPALADLVAAVHDAGDDVLVATDEEGGDVTRLHMREGSPFPGNAALGVADDVTLTESVARAIGTELASVGVDLDLAPVVDVNCNPANPVIGVRSFGASPQLVARHATAYVTGLQSAGVGACAKHFPGHGDTVVDSHLGLPTVDTDRATLDGRELRPFAAAIGAGAVAVMTSHVLVPALDRDRPATMSPPVLAVLRDELGFDGLVVSDALDMAGASAGRGVPAAAVAALAAGCDQLCLGPDPGPTLVRATVDAIEAAVSAGSLDEARLVDAAARTRRAWERVRALPRVPVPADRATAAARAVADRAVAVSGDLPPQRDALVLRLVTEPTIAVGAVPWGLPSDGGVLDGRAAVDVGPAMPVADLLRAAGDRPVVAVVRDPHRHPWVLETLCQVAARRPDLVVVDLGWPGRCPLPGAAVVRTHGAAPVNAAAADAVLSAGRAGAPC